MTTDSEVQSQPQDNPSVIRVKLWKEFKRNGQVFVEPNSERVVDVDPLDYENFYEERIDRNGKEVKSTMSKIGFKYEKVTE